MLHILFLCAFAGAARALSLSDAEAKRTLASMQTEEAAMLEAQFHADHAAGLHDQMLKISDDFFSASASAGTPREQALRASFHRDGFYHTLFDVAETLKDYAFLETEVLNVQAHAALKLGASPSRKEEKRALISTRGQSEFIEMKAQWGWAKKQAKKAKKRLKAAARKAEQHMKKVKRSLEEAKKKAIVAARAVAKAAARAAKAVANALSQATTALSNLREDIKKGVKEVADRTRKVGNFAKEVVSEIKEAADNVKTKAVTVASTMKRVAGHIKDPFDHVLSHLRKNLPTALRDKSDCHKLKIKPSGVGVKERNFRKCFNWLPGKPCPSITILVPALEFDEKTICNPSKAVKNLVQNAFKSVSNKLKTSAKAAIDEIVDNDHGGRFLETAEGQGNTAQLLAKVNEQQGAGAKALTRNNLRASAMSLSECAADTADFAFWFRYGMSFQIGSGTLGGSISANLGLALGCDGAGTAFMFPTIDVGLDVTAGAGVNPAVDQILSIDVFANFDGLGVHGSKSLFFAGTGHEIDTPSPKSVWGNKLGWGLSTSLNVGDYGMGFSFTMPALQIGTSSILGIEFPSSANFKRPRLAGIGIYGDASKIWNILTGPIGFIEDTFKRGVDAPQKPELSISIGIGYVGIIGGKNANWMNTFGKVESRKPAKGASCNNLLNGLAPSSVYDCGSNVFEALPRTILTEWPFN